MSLFGGGNLQQHRQAPRIRRRSLSADGASHLWRLAGIDVFAKLAAVSQGDTNSKNG